MRSRLHQNGFAGWLFQPQDTWHNSRCDQGNSLGTRALATSARLEQDQPTVFCAENSEAQFCWHDSLSINKSVVVAHNFGFRDGRGCELFEFSERVSGLEELEGAIYDPESVLEVLTLAHAHCVPSKDLGFCLVEGDQTPIFDVDIPEDEMKINPNLCMRPLQSLKRPNPWIKTASSPLRRTFQLQWKVLSTLQIPVCVLSELVALHLVCQKGVPRKNVSSAWLNNVEHMRTQSLISESVEAKLKQGSERHAIPQRKPKKPSEQVKDVHALTHEPYEKWRSLCVNNRAKHDPHRRQIHEGVGHSVVSFDFGYCSCMKRRVIHDKDTKMCATLPTQQKGGRGFQYLVTEMSRFIVQTGINRSHEIQSEVWLWAKQPLSEAVRKTCVDLRIVVHLEPTPTGDHQANGAAEAMVHVLRTKASLLVQHQFSVVFTQFILEQLCTTVGCTIALLWTKRQLDMSDQQDVFTQANPLFLEKRCWVTSKVTWKDFQNIPREFGLQKVWWMTAMWLGLQQESLSPEASGRFLLLEQVGDFTVSPWEYGYANLGHRLVYSKRVIITTLSCRSGNQSAASWQGNTGCQRLCSCTSIWGCWLWYDLGRSGNSKFNWRWTSREAEISTSMPASEKIGNGGPSSSARPDSGMPQAEGSFGGPSKHAIEYDDVGAEAKRLHLSGYGESLPHGEVVPQTLVSVAGDVWNKRWTLEWHAQTPMETLCNTA